VPSLEPTPELLEIVEQVRINPSGELPEPLPIPAASEALNKLDGFQPTATDLREAESTFSQLKGQFLIDRRGIVRWANLECGKEGAAGIGKFPTHDELLDAAKLVVD
jgi:hypothetical protein